MDILNFFFHMDFRLCNSCFLNNHLVTLLVIFYVLVNYCIIFAKLFMFPKWDLLTLDESAIASEDKRHVCRCVSQFVLCNWIGEYIFRLLNESKISTYLSVPIAPYFYITSIQYSNFCKIRLKPRRSSNWRVSIFFHFLNEVAISSKILHRVFIQLQFIISQKL